LGYSLQRKALSHFPCGKKNMTALLMAGALQCTEGKEEVAG